MNDDDILIRNTPAKKANLYAEGYAMDGADGSLYFVKANKNGIKRWVKYLSSDAEKKADKLRMEKLRMEINALEMEFNAKINARDALEMKLNAEINALEMEFNANKAK